MNERLKEKNNLCTYQIAALFSLAIKGTITGVGEKNGLFFSSDYYLINLDYVLYQINYQPIYSKTGNCFNLSKSVSYREI